MPSLGHFTRCRGEVREVLLLILYAQLRKKSTVNLSKIKKFFGYFDKLQQINTKQSKLRHIKTSLLEKFDSYVLHEFISCGYSSTYSMMSPGWQWRYEHNRSSVLVSILPSPFFILVKAACEIMFSVLILYVVIPCSFNNAKSLSYLNGISAPAFYHLVRGRNCAPFPLSSLYRRICTMSSEQYTQYYSRKIVHIAC